MPSSDPHPRLAGINARDELRCDAEHKMQPLPLLPANAKDNVLQCDLCTKWFTRCGKDYGCAECGEGGEYESLVLDCPRFSKKLARAAASARGERGRRRGAVAPTPRGGRVATTAPRQRHERPTNRSKPSASPSAPTPRPS